MMKNHGTMVGRFVGILGLVASQLALAVDVPPQCIAIDRKTRQEHVLGVNNDHVLKLKKTTPNQTLSRAYVAGRYLKAYSDPSNGAHDHFSIQIGQTTQKEDRLEVVYNVEFGRLPRLNVGDIVEACGDYITSNADTYDANGHLKYRRSDDDAIIHWVHENPRGRGHESGFLRINGVVYGHRGIHYARPRTHFHAHPNP